MHGYIHIYEHRKRLAEGRCKASAGKLGAEHTGREMHGIAVQRMHREKGMQILHYWRIDSSSGEHAGNNNKHNITPRKLASSA